MPSFGDLFTDLRGENRTMRVSYHPDRDAVVLSLWSGTFCTGSFRMPTDDVDRLMEFLAEVRQAAVGKDEPTGSGPATVEVAAIVTDPAMERTGEISGTTALRVTLPVPSTPRVA